MRIRPDQVAAHVGKSLQSLYLVSGDEPLQVNEACDAIRAAARAQGYDDRQVFDVDARFDWGALMVEANSLSLFAQRRILELRARSSKIGTDGSAALVEFAARPPQDILLLITIPKLEKEAQNSKWLRSVEDAGVFVQVWPVEAGQLPAWIERRMRAHGMRPTPEAVTMLADRVEGNLLAAAQEIDKLALLYGDANVDVDQIAQAVVDSARFDVYGFTDAALAGDTARVARMMDGLRGEGEAPTLVLWALTREIRTLCAMAQEKKQGAALPGLLSKYRVWDKRKGPVEKALARHGPQRWRQLLRRCGNVDRVIKGREMGNEWDELLELALLVSGTMLFKRASAARSQ